MSLAWFLEKKGYQNIHLFEKNATIGGILQTDVFKESIIEQAAESVGMYPKTIMQLLEALGLSNEIIYPKTAQFQIYVNCKLHNPPQGLRFMVPTQVELFNNSPFFSEAGKLRIVEELNVAPITTHKEESLKDFVLRRFGEEMYTRYAAPVYGGIFGYAAEQLSIQSVLPQLPKWEKTYGSITKAVQTLYPDSFLNQSQASKSSYNFFSLKNGMHSLPKTIAEQLNYTRIFLNHPIQQLNYKNTIWKIEEDSFDSVYITTAAPIASKLLVTSYPTLSKQLNKIPFKSAGIVTFIFNQHDIVLDKNISGILLPVEDFPACSAITFSANKWANRVDDSKVMLRLYLRDTPLLDQPKRQIVSIALQSLQQLVQVNNHPLKSHYNLWRHSRPLYKIGHQAMLQEIELTLNKLPGLQLCGCSYKGSGLASLVHQSKVLALDA